MGKKKKFSKVKVSVKEKFDDNRDDGNLLDPTSRNFIYDEVDDFNDPDYGVKTSIASDEEREEQVLGIGGLSSDEDVDSELDDSENSTDDDDDNDLFEDLESNKDKRVFDERLMGRKKKDFFGTDIPDEKIHNEARRRSKGESLSLIEEGAKKLQERMAAQLEGLTYAHLLPQDEKKESPDSSKCTEVKDEAEDESFTNSKALRLLKKNSPEFIPTVETLKQTCSEVSAILSPLIEAKKSGMLPESPVTEYLQTRYSLCLNYITVVASYLMLKCSRNSNSNHPIVSRVAQYRHLFKELEPCRKKYETELIVLLKDFKEGRLKTSSKAEKDMGKRKMLGIISKVAASKTNEVQSLSDGLEDSDGEMNDGMELDEDMDQVLHTGEDDGTSTEEDETASGKKDMKPVVLGAEERRKITYQIAKNKGLMPSRKKEQRNPRVKYRRKFADKLKRRKGQIREVRKEIQKYGGEISGIKANLVKSIKLK